MMPAGVVGCAVSLTSKTEGCLPGLFLLIMCSASAVAQVSPQADTPLDGVDIIDGMLDAELVDKVQLGGKATNDLETANHAQVSVPQGALEQEASDTQTIEERLAAAWGGAMGRPTEELHVARPQVTANLAVHESAETEAPVDDSSQEESTARPQSASPSVSFFSGAVGDDGKGGMVATDQKAQYNVTAVDAASFHVSVSLSPTNSPTELEKKAFFPALCVFLVGILLVLSIKSFSVLGVTLVWSFIMSLMEDEARKPATDDEQKVADQSSEKPAKVRDPTFDNAKIVFIFYVVLYHSTLDWQWNPIYKSDEWGKSAKALWKAYILWGEMLAIPGFVFLSGFFAKSFLDGDQAKQTARFRNTISVCVIGLFLSQSIKLLFSTIAAKAIHPEGPWVLAIKKDRQWAPFNTLWDEAETWYLVALLLWRLGTPLIQAVKYPLTVALILSLIGSHTFWGTNTQEMRIRVFHYYPLYVGGTICSKEALTAMNKRKHYAAAASCLVLMFGLMVVLELTTGEIVQPDDIRDEDKKIIADDWLAAYHSDATSLKGVMRDVTGWACKNILMVIATFSVLVLVRIVPFNLLPFSHGLSTLVIFVWHWPVAAFMHGYIGPSVEPEVQLTWSAHKFFFDKFPMGVAMLCMHVEVYLICFLLGNKAVLPLLGRLVVPPTDWLWKKTEKEMEEAEQTEMFQDSGPGLSLKKRPAATTSSWVL